MYAVILLALLLAATPAHANPRGLPVSGRTATTGREDDGALQRGKPFKYKVKPNGTVQDLRTGLVWEVKCADCPPDNLHYVGNCDLGWNSEIWNWLAAVNAENYAGHNDWRIPNVR